MAHPKKGQLHQILVPMVDSTDFASVESAITESDFNSGATKKFYGWNTGASTATTSGTISKTASLVRSGVFRITLKTTENNYDGMMVRVTKTGCAEQIITWSNVDSDDSDMMSALTVIQSMASDAASAAQQGSSRALINQSRISDVASYLVAMSGVQSDIYSLVSDLNSNIFSRIPKEPAARSQLSDLASDLLSYLTGISGTLSDTYSQLSDFRSDLASLVTTTGVQLNASSLSDIRSAIGDVSLALTASDISDIASAVAVAVGSTTSDIYSLLSDLNSNFNSRIPKEPAARSQLSDLASDLLSYLTGLSGTISDTYSLVSDLNSNIFSRIPKEPAARSQLSDHHSDLRSQIGALDFSIDASDISDIASAVRATLISDLSDIHSAATAGASRALLNQSRISDVYSMLSDFQSDFGSRIPKEPSARSQLSDLASDLLSYLTGISSLDSNIYSLLSDLESNFGSRIPKEPAARSQLSDLSSDILSDLRSFIGAGVELGASTLSDIRSAIAATELDASDLSDIASAVWARVGAEPGSVPALTASMGAKADWLFAMSRNKLIQTETKQSLRNDADAATIASAAIADDTVSFVRGKFA